MQYNSTGGAWSVAPSGPFYTALEYLLPASAEVVESVGGAPFQKPAGVTFDGMVGDAMMGAAAGGQAVATAFMKGDGGEFYLASYVRASGQWAALPNLVLGADKAYERTWINNVVMLPSGSAVLVLKAMDPAPGLGVKRLQLP